jgi:uncharacterized cupredoxin-like copper-binding protein
MEDTHMADLPPYRTPRWVKVFGIIVIGLVLLAGVVLVVTTALGLHTPGGPGGHGLGGDMPPASGDENTGGVGAPAAADEAARTVEVIALDTMTFEPSRINVAAGETVAFRVTNTGQAVHEFTLGDAAMQQAHADEMAQMGDGMAHDQANSITVQPGETKQLTWRFGEAGTLEYACHQPGHYQAGMRGQVTIK